MAPLTLVYQDDILRIYWHEKHQYYLSDWQPVFRKGEELRRAYQACIDAARTRPGAPWLSDASKYAVVDPADAKWIAEVFLPDFAKAGARVQAVIAPAKQVGKMSATRASESLPKLGALLTSAHLSRADAEAAIVEWQQKQRRR